MTTSFQIFRILSSVADAWKLLTLSLKVLKLLTTVTSKHKLEVNGFDAEKLLMRVQVLGAF